MTLEAFNTLLETTGLQVAYRNFNKRQELPFICYMVAGSNNFSADGVVYRKVDIIHVELYTAIKSPEIEEKVEKALSSFFWQKTENYIDSERCYQIVYELEVIRNV